MLGEEDTEGEGKKKNFSFKVAFRQSRSTLGESASFSDDREFFL
jgi:hypothetical protein